MSAFGRKLSREQEKARARTQRGTCSRCGKAVQQHQDGNCPDGGGTYSWAMTRQDAERCIERLEQALHEHRTSTVVLTPEEQRVLDHIVSEIIRGSTTIRPSDVATALGMAPHQARAIIESLQAKGMLEKVPPPPS